MLGALLAVAVIVWARVTGVPWEHLGLARPASWPWTIVGGVALGVALKLLLKAVVMPLLGAPAANATYAYVAGNVTAFAQTIVMVLVVGGVAEEIFWRGFLFERLGRLLGSGVASTIAIVLVTSIAFALAHYSDQGVPGVEQSIVTGLTFGAVFAMTGVLWPVMIAHAAYDVLAVWLIYSGLEDAVAHLVFK